MTDTIGAQERKPYIAPAIRRELKLETLAAASMPAVDDLEFDPVLPGKPSDIRQPDGGIDPMRPAKPSGGGGGGDGSFDVPRPPKPPGAP